MIHAGEEFPKPGSKEAEISGNRVFMGHLLAITFLIIGGVSLIQATDFGALFVAGWFSAWIPLLIMR